MGEHGAHAPGSQASLKDRLVHPQLLLPPGKFSFHFSHYF